jgi:hypothetical protein
VVSTEGTGVYATSGRNAIVPRLNTYQVSRPLRAIGSLFVMSLDISVSLVKPPLAWRWREFVSRSRFAVIHRVRGEGC